MGFLEVVAGRCRLADAVWTRSHHQLGIFAGCARIVRLPHPIRHLCLEGGEVVLRSTADQIRLCDRRPGAARCWQSTSERHLRHIDSYVLVVEWGKTKIDEVQYALRHAPGVQDNMAGVVLNKVDMAAMSLYDSYGAQYYYGRPRFIESDHGAN